MKSTFLILILSMLSGSWGQGAKLYNKLTPEEVRDGYELLFDGKNLDKWKSYKVDRPRESWKPVKKGDHNVLRVVPGDRGHIFTKNATYQNFDLKLEWLVPVRGNSGIFIRYMENAGSDWGGHTGPEAQVVDKAHSDGKRPKHQAGVCYDMFPLDKGRENWFNPTGEFNEFRIIAFEKRVAHYGNGKKLLEYEIGSERWNAAYAASKYNTKPLFKDIHPGSIYLQHHGEIGIEYRNLRIKKLGANEDPWAKGSPHLTADGLVQDLTFNENIYPKAAAKPGCPDPTYKEFDSTRTVDDMSLCKTPITTRLVRFFENLDKPIKIQQVSGQIVVHFPFEAAYSIAILDQAGRKLKFLPEKQMQSAVFSTESLASGLYIINISKGKDTIRRMVFVP